MLANIQKPSNNKDIGRKIHKIYTGRHAVPKAYSRRAGVISKERYFGWALFAAFTVSPLRFIRPSPTKGVM